MLAVLYEIEGLMDQYEYNVELASAHALGIDSANISSEETRKQIKIILDQNTKVDGHHILVEEMCEREDEYEKNLNLLQAFANGFGV